MSSENSKQEEDIRRIVQEALDAERKKRLEEEGRRRRLDEMVRLAYPHLYR